MFSSNSAMLPHNRGYFDNTLYLIADRRTIVICLNSAVIVPIFDNTRLDLAY